MACDCGVVQGAAGPRDPAGAELQGDRHPHRLPAPARQCKPGIASLAQLLTLIFSHILSS